MSEHLKIGEIIHEDQQRDAIHIAVVPVEAGEWLHPGAQVRIADGAAFENDRNSHGVVDPFLKEPVLKGQRCWVFLNPGSITSLRHEWTHPALDANEEVTAAVKRAKFELDGTSPERYLQKFAQDEGMEFSDFLDYLRSNVENGYGSHSMSSDVSEDLNNEKEKVLDALEAVSNTRFSARQRESVYFSCSC